jgi:hypothetical protein
MDPIEIKKSSRSGRYRKILMPPEELIPYSQNLEKLFASLQEKRNARELSDAEFLSYGLLALLACRRIDAFQKNPSVQISKNTTQENFLLTDFFVLLKNFNLPMAAFKKFTDQEINIFEFLSRNRFRGIPDSARQALMQWLEKKYPLHLFFYIPTIGEVFNMQKWGGRCVSFFMNNQSLTQLHHDRDVISFIVHDLIHANEFYSNKEMAEQQIGFYQWLDEIKNIPDLQLLIAKSNGFKERWEYLLSDMNSYCGHLLKTFHAALKIHTSESESIRLWSLIVENSNLTPAERVLFLKINTIDWVDKDFYILEDVFKNKFNGMILAQLDKSLGQ